MSLYYQDDTVTLHCGDSLEVLPTLDMTADVLLTDPPYFKVKQDEWDNQWDKAGEFLGWMGGWLDHAKPLLAPHASVWVFASPAMTSSVERVVGERFRVLNAVRWVKEAGWHQKSSLPDMRRFLTPWEGLVFAEQHGASDAYTSASESLWSDLFSPLRDYLNERRGVAGLTVRDVDAAWQKMRGTKGQMAGHWFGTTQWGFPTRDHWRFLRSLGLDLCEYDEARSRYDALRKQYDTRREPFMELRRPFSITDRAVSTDVWAFPAVKPYKGKHPCEKPQLMLAHMIETSSRPGWTILDPFAGSGSTLLAARNAGRKAIGIEKDEAWCEKIALRLSENTLNLEGAA